MKQEIVRGIAELKEAFPGEQLIEDRLEMAAYLEDASLINGDAGLVILAEGPEDVRRALSICQRHRLPAAARGRATGYTGGCVPVENSVVISLERWRGVEHLDCLRQTVTAAPGTTIGEINAAARTAGLFFPPDPVSMEHCSIGGAVAENSSGPRCLRFGPTHQFIDSVELFLTNGESVTVKKDGSGPWAPFFHVLIGSEGTFGIVGRVTCRLVALPKHVCLLRLEFDDPALIQPVQKRLYDSRMDFSAMEMITPAFGPDSGINGRYILYLETFCDNLEAVEADAAAVKELIRDLPVDIKPNAGDLYARRGEGYRESRALIKNALNHHPVAQLIDGVVARKNLGNTVTGLFKIAERYRCPMLHTFHFGDGNIHPTFFHRADSSASERKHAILEEVTSLCLNAGGSIAGEHGIGLEKREFMLKAHSHWELDAFAAVKKKFDPLNLANPGKLIPVRQENKNTSPGNGNPRSVLFDFQDSCKIDPLQMTALIDAGITCREFRTILADHDFFFAFETFGRHENETVKHMLFTPCFNLYGLRFGELRDQLTGVRYVGTGENALSIDCGGHVVKNVSGYSIYRLEPGALGRIDISALCMRIFNPLESRAFEVSFKTLDYEKLRALCRLAPDYYCWVTFRRGEFVMVMRSRLPYRKLREEIARFIPDVSCTEVATSEPLQRLGKKGDVETLIVGDTAPAGELLTSGRIHAYCPQLARGFKYE